MKIAIIIPCLNEGASISQVVRDCKHHMPQAEVYVLDNGSEDNTSEVAEAAGARVIHSPLRGKGNVIRHAFRVIDADYFIMIDGDGTYPMSEAPRLLKIAQEFNYEMVCGSRLNKGKPQAFRRFHLFGNRLFTGLVQFLFNSPVRDLLTGYRVFSRRFAEEMSLLSQGFEIETELTIRSVAQALPFCEIDIEYAERVQGTKSKLRTFRDGFRILLTITRFTHYYHPFRFYTAMTFLSLGAWWFAPLSIKPVLQNLPAFLYVLGLYLNSNLNLKRMHRKHERFAAQSESPTSMRHSA